VVEARADLGTFVRQPARRLLASQSALERELSARVRRARTAGWEREDVVALVEETLRAASPDRFQDRHDHEVDVTQQRRS
jgi:hypothetical protein